MALTDWTVEKRNKFIEVLSETGNISTAAKAAGISRQTAYKYKNADPEFAEEWKQAEEDAADVLEKEAWRRAVSGVDEPVFYKGDLISTVRKYSDTLLIFLLKGNKPEKFAERVKQDVTGSVTVKLEDFF